MTDRRAGDNSTPDERPEDSRKGEASPGQESVDRASPGRASADQGSALAERLEELRAEIAALDSELIALLARRLAIAAEIGEVKKALGRPVLDPAREAEVVRRAAELARRHGIDPEVARDVLWRLMSTSRGVQDED